jgi:esterase/lipase superfamily enzyme
MIKDGCAHTFPRVGFCAGNVSADLMVSMTGDRGRLALLPCDLSLKRPPRRHFNHVDAARGELIFSPVGRRAHHRVRYFGCAADLAADTYRSTMNREYHKAYSQELHRDMEALVFGHAGSPLLVFPTSMGRFFEYEDRGVIGVLAPKIERGELQVFCPDAVDTESWYNKSVHPRVRVMRHLQYERYILHEFLPFVRWKNQTPLLEVTGCSFGGYHAVNFALKHPDVVTHCVSMSGAFDIHQFLDGYYDDDCYFNCPPDFLPNQGDDWFLSRYRKMNIVLGSADWDICLDQNVKFSAILNAKGIPHWLDVWGDNSKHDWPLWQRMAVKYFS